jgi:acetyltransferase-like isoleucine patch superfamily enzyme
VAKLHKVITDESKSAFRRYQEIVLDKPGFFSLLKYELLVFLTSWIPGALGLVVRKKTYAWLLGSCGKNPVFGQNVVVRHGGKITLGDNVVIEDNVVLDAKGEDNEGIRIGDNSFIGRNSVLSCKNGSIEIGAQVSLGMNCIVHSVEESKVVIGDNCPIAAFCYFIGGGNYYYDRTDVPIVEQGIYSKGGIFIEENVWVGAHVKILDGIKIGTGSILAAGAAVYRNIPKMSIAGGVPAKVVRRRI